jgi:hypothetical protein
MPEVRLFKPAGVSARELEQVPLLLDEFEAIRLADLHGLYHDKAAAKMGVSRPTFGRVLESGRRKIADALANGKAILIHGGTVEMSDTRTFVCDSCNHQWTLMHGTGCPTECPECKSTRIHRDPSECRQHQDGHHGAEHGGKGHCCRNRGGHSPAKS